MPDASGVLLEVGGIGYGGWKAARVRRSMEQCAGGFTLDVSELWPGNDLQRPVRPGEACVLRHDGEPVVTGYVDQVEMRVDDRRHEVRVTGRDRTADLIDCSAMARAGQWRGQTVERIAADLAEPYGVTVVTEVDTGQPLASFALQEGETAFDAIDRAARVRGLLLTSDGAGRLVITRAGARRAPTALVLGQNLLWLGASLDARDRYSDYVAKGQAPGTDAFSGAEVAHIKAHASDPGMQRYRLLVVTDDCPDVAGGLRQRVRWEASVRAARSTLVRAKVQGWRHAAGLWEPNALVTVRAPLLQLDHELLITEVDYELDDQGTVATLTMTRADAYSVLPVREAPAGAAPGAFWAIPKAAA